MNQIAQVRYSSQSSLKRFLWRLGCDFIPSFFIDPGRLNIDMKHVKFITETASFSSNFKVNAFKEYALKRPQIIPDFWAAFVIVKCDYCSNFEESCQLDRENIAWFQTHGIDINKRIKSKDHWYTPLQIACLQGFTEFAIALFQVGASIDALTEDGRSLLDLATLTIISYRCFLVIPKPKTLAILFKINVAWYVKMDNEQKIAVITHCVEIQRRKHTLSKTNREIYQKLSLMLPYCPHL